MLTITGYSTNDTIVIFDRVRENLRGDAARLARPRHQRRRSTRRSAGRSSPSGTALLAVARAVLLRRRSAARLRVHDGRRHHHRHLFERVHRRGDRQLLARPGPTRAAAHAPAPRRPPRRSSPRASRSRSGRRGLRKLSAISSQLQLRRTSSTLSRVSAGALTFMPPLFKRRSSVSFRDSPSSCRCRRRLTC